MAATSSSASASASSSAAAHNPFAEAAVRVPTGAAAPPTPLPAPDSKTLEEYEQLKKHVTSAVKSLPVDQAREQELAALEIWAAAVHALGNKVKKAGALERAERENKRITELNAEIRRVSESKEVSAFRTELIQLEMQALNKRLAAAKETLKHYVRVPATLEIKSAVWPSSVSAYVVATWYARSSPAFPFPIGKTTHMASATPMWSKSLPFEWVQSVTDPAVLHLQVYEHGLLRDTLLGEGHWEMTNETVPHQIQIVKPGAKEPAPEEQVDATTGKKTVLLKYAPDDILGTVSVQVTAQDAPKTLDAKPDAEPKNPRHGCFASVASDETDEKKTTPGTPVVAPTTIVQVKADVPAAPGVVPILDTPQPPPPAPVTGPAPGDKFTGDKSKH